MQFKFFDTDCIGVLKKSHIPPTPGARLLAADGTARTVCPRETQPLDVKPFRPRLLEAPSRV